MANAKSRPTIEKLRETLNSLSKVDWIRPAIRPELGALAFMELVPIFENFKNSLQLLRAADLDLLPDDRAVALQNAASQVGSHFNLVTNFDIRGANTEQTRANIIDSTNQRYSAFFDLAGPILGASAARKLSDQHITDIVRTAVLTEIRAAIADIDKIRNGITKIEEASTNAERTLAALKEAAGKVGVTAYAKIFADEADEYKVASRIWVILTVFMAVATTAWGFVALQWIPVGANATTAQIVQEALSRVIVFSGLSYGLVWCARNYSANRHNYVLNKHRQNSVSTFETFVQAVENKDPDTKNAILIQATSSIFAAHNTGYSGREPEVDQPSKVMEIFRSVKQ